MMKSFALALATIASFTQESNGMFANPNCLNVELDGCAPACVKQMGNPFQHWHATENGYTLCRKAVDGKTQYEFAKADPTAELGYICSGEILSCSQKKPSFPQEPLMRPPPIATQEEQDAGWEETLAARIANEANEPGRRRLQGVRQLKSLVLLIRWSDHKDLPLPTPNDYRILVSQKGGDPNLAPTGSVQDIFDFSLYNNIQIDPAVVGWIDVPFTQQEGAGNPKSDGSTCGGSCSSAKLRDAIYWALDNAESRGLVDISQFDTDGNDRLIDMFTVIHSGYGAETGDDRNTAWVWSHKWQLKRTYYSKRGNVRISQYNVNPGRWGTEGFEISRPAVIAHEQLHFLGLPDLYDTDYSSRGIGSHGLMANSWGLDGQQRYPPSLSPWAKLTLGVISPQQVGADGVYELTASQEDPTQFFRFDMPSGNDYLLLEYRAKISFDSLSGGGFLLWHMDPSKSSNREEGYPGSSGWPRSHYKVRLIQMDGKYDLEKNENRGDHTDFFKAPEAFGSEASAINIATEISDLTEPTLNGYTMIANRRCSGHLLKDFSRNFTQSLEIPAPKMTFTYVAMKQDCSGVPVNDGDGDDDEDPDDPEKEVYVWDETICRASWRNARDGCDCECVKAIKRSELLPNQKFAASLQGMTDPDCARSGQRLYCGGYYGGSGEVCVNDVCVGNGSPGATDPNLRDRIPKEGAPSQIASKFPVLPVVIGCSAFAVLALGVAVKRRYSLRKVPTATTVAAAIGDSDGPQVVTSNPRYGK